MSEKGMNTTELFDDFIDGDDAYSSIFDELDVPFAEEICVPSFNCLGEVNVKDVQVSRSSYYYSKYGPDKLLAQQKLDKGKIEKISLFGKTWDKGTCLLNYLDQLFKLASMKLMLLDDSSVIQCGSVAPDEAKKKFYQIRTECIELIVFVNDFISRVLMYKEYEWIAESLEEKLTKRLTTLRKQLGSITQLPEYIYLFCSNSSGNKCEEAGYHVIHSRFDMLWLDLHLSCTLHKYKAVNASLHSSYLHQYYLPLLRQLFDLTLVRFNKIDQRDLSKKSPFSCTCVQELWLMLQIIADADSKDNSDKGFWSVFDSFLLSFLKLRASPQQLDGAGIVNQFKIDSSKFSRSQSYIFSIWFTYSLAKLYLFDQREVISNYSLIEILSKNLLSEDVGEEDMRKYLHYVEKICLELWSVKTEPILLLWEYYQKRLNQLFYIPGQDLDTIVTIGKSALSFLSQVKGRLEDPYLVKNSFEHFLRIVGLHLQRCTGINEHQRHMNLMTGRIYSKLTPPKLLSLNQTGQHNFVSLYLTLAISADLNQVVNKFSDVCTAYTSFKGSLSSELLKGQLSLCLLSIERGQSIERLIPPLTKTLAGIDIEANRELFSLTIDAFADILDHHNSLTLGQHLFIDSWMGRYLSHCSQSECLKLLDVLLSLVNRVKNQINNDPNKEMSEIVERVWSQLGSYLMSSTSSSYIILSDIAACLASIYLVLSNKQRFNSIIQLFSNNTTSDVRIVQRFILQLLDDGSKVKESLTNLDSLIVETWIRSNIVVCDIDESEMKSLCSIMSKMPDIQRICRDHHHVFSSHQPLVEFFSSVLSNYNTTTNESEKAWLCSKVSSYLKDLDKWVKPLISTCQAQSSQHISHIYLTVGTTFSLISHLLYVKSKPNSLIQCLISLLLLPVSVHNSEFKIHPFILTSIRKTIHLFLQGLNQLGPSTDPYINRCIKELILVYIPRCLSNTGPLPSQSHISTFSLVSLFNEFDQSLHKLILDNIAVNFFRAKARNPLPNTIHGVRFVKEVLLLHSSNESVLLSLLQYCMEHICDIMMYCDNKTTVYIMSKDVVRLFFDNHTLKHSNLISNEVEELLSKLCSTNLAWSSRQLFDFLFILCNYVPNVMKRFLPKLLQNIRLIETKRGVSNDKVLRLGYERIASKLS